MKIAAELAGCIFKAAIDFRGKVRLCECGSAEISEGADDTRRVIANVLDDSGYLSRTTVRIYASDEFANAGVAEINYPVSLLASL